MLGKQHLYSDPSLINLAGMTKEQLYDIMREMKTVVDEDKEAARQMLIQNPQFTKVLFQGQVMLGMIKNPKEVPKIAPQAAQVSAQPPHQPNVPAMPTQIGLQDQTLLSQAPNAHRKQQPNQTLMPVSSPSVPSLNVQSQPSQMHPPHSAQLPNLHPLTHAAAHQPPLQPPMPLNAASTQSQQPLHNSGLPLLQPPLPPQPIPASVSTFGHQFLSQPGPNAALQHSAPPRMHQSQPTFHSAQNQLAITGPTSFSQGHPTFPMQSPPHSFYQGGVSHPGSEFSQVGKSMPGLREIATGGHHLTGPPPFTGGNQAGPSSQTPRPQPLTPDMESALLQQVMSLTPEQIDLLPPDQRSQVLQLQRMLRQ